MCFFLLVLYNSSVVVVVVVLLQWESGTCRYNVYKLMFIFQMALYKGVIVVELASAGRILLAGLP